MNIFINFTRINQEDEARIKCVREIICRKEQKMKKMAQERDLAIRESRQQAQMTANLREHLRCVHNGKEGL